MSRSLFSKFVVVALLASTAGGCVVRAHGRFRTGGVIIVEDEPPPPRVVAVETRPGFFFVEGRWVRDRGRWVWVDGHYERERVGHVWEQGHWERRGRGHVWVEGRWRAGAPAAVAPDVRDHRAPAPPPPPPPPPTVRDHRH